MLDKEFKYYKENQAKLVEKYLNKFIVIVGSDIVGVYDSEMEAYAKSKENYTLGTFLIQKCVPGTDSYTQTFHSRVVFS